METLKKFLPCPHMFVFEGYIFLPGIKKQIQVDTHYVYYDHLPILILICLITVIIF